MSSQSRLQQQLQTLPPATLAILSLLGGFYVLQILVDWDVRLYTFCPMLIMEQNQVWRLVTSTVLHGSIFHIAMNFMSAWGLCMTLERTMGTVPLILTTIGSILGSPLVHLLLAVIPHKLLGYHPWYQEHSLGYSGVLFHYAVVEAATTHNTHSSSRSVLGLFTVSNTLYPWALLVALQVFIPNLSFLGHLSGLLTGVLQTQYFASSCSCHNATLEQFGITTFPNFVPNATLERSHDMPTTTTSCRHLCSIGCTYIGYIVETIQVIVCGRRNHDDSNTHMESEFGDEWIGLPLSADSGDMAESRIV